MSVGKDKIANEEQSYCILIFHRYYIWMLLPEKEKAHVIQAVFSRLFSDCSRVAL